MVYKVAGRAGRLERSEQMECFLAAGEDMGGAIPEAAAAHPYMVGVEEGVEVIHPVALLFSVGLEELVHRAGGRGLARTARNQVGAVAGRGAITPLEGLVELASS